MMSKCMLASLAFSAGSLMTVSAIAGPFTFLDPAYKQELVVATGNNVAGVVLGKDGFLYTNDAGGSQISKWNPASRVSVNGSSVYANVATVSDVAGGNWGITIDSVGNLYSLGSSGLYSVDRNTLLGTLVGPAGYYGLAYAAASDSFYSSTGGSIVNTRKDGTVTTFTTDIPGGFADQVAIAPSGNFVAGALLSANQVGVWNTATGVLAGAFDVGHSPDGLAFDNNGNIFTNNTDGTVTKLNFSGPNYTGFTGTTLIASGGFYGDLASVGTDGAFYLSQYGIRYDDGTVASGASIVRLTLKNGGGFDDGGTGGDDDPNGGGGGMSPVPEPSTYGLMAAAALVGLILHRRRSASTTATAAV